MLQRVSEGLMPEFRREAMGQLKELLVDNPKVGGKRRGKEEGRELREGLKLLWLITWRVGVCGGPRAGWEAGGPPGWGASLTLGGKV